MVVALVEINVEGSRTNIMQFECVHVCSFVRYDFILEFVMSSIYFDGKCAGCRENLTWFSIELNFGIKLLLIISTNVYTEIYTFLC